MLVDRKELARLLNVSPDTIKRWTTSRKISVIKIKHVYRYHPDTVLADLQNTAQIKARRDLR